MGSAHGTHRWDPWQQSYSRTPAYNQQQAPPAPNFPPWSQGKQAGAAGIAGRRNRAVSPTHHRPHSSGQGAAEGSGTLALGTASLVP